MEVIRSLPIPNVGREMKLTNSFSLGVYHLCPKCGNEPTFPRPGLVQEIHVRVAERADLFLILQLICCLN